MLSNKCLVTSYISQLEPKNIMPEKNLPILNFFLRGLRIYVALRPTAYFHPLNTWIPLFYYFLYVKRALKPIHTLIYFSKKDFVSYF